MNGYMARLFAATVMLTVVALGGPLVYLMWEYVANAYETWEYFPRGMFIIPAGITFSWGILALMMAWLWINSLFNTKYAREMEESDD